MSYCLKPMDWRHIFSLQETIGRKVGHLIGTKYDIFTTVNKADCWRLDLTIQVG